MIVYGFIEVFPFLHFQKSNLFFTKRLVFTYNSATNIGKKKQSGNTHCHFFAFYRTFLSDF